jgi:hypothetical protein
MTYGGSKVRLLNWEYGARLHWPSRFFVDIHPIGRGITQAFQKISAVAHTSMFKFELLYLERIPPEIVLRHARLVKHREGYFRQ